MVILGVNNIGSRDIGCTSSSVERPHPPRQGEAAPLEQANPYRRSAYRLRFVLLFMFDAVLIEYYDCIDWMLTSALVMLWRVTKGVESAFQGLRRSPNELCT